MGIDMKNLFVPLLLCLVCSCGGRGAATTVAVSHVDSAVQSAADTLRASIDTSRHKKDTAAR